MQLEIDGNQILHSDRLPPLHSRLPFRHGFRYAQGFFVTTMSNASQHLKIGETTIWLDNEPYIHSSLGTSFFSFFRILNMIGNELNKLFIPTWKLWHFLHNLINIIFGVFNFTLNRRRNKRLHKTFGDILIYNLIHYYDITRCI